MVRRRNLLMGIALAGLAGGLSLAHSCTIERAVMKRVQGIDVVALQRAVPAGTRLESRMLTLRRVPRPDILPGAYHSLAQAVGRWTVVPLWPGDQVITGRTAGGPGPGGTSTLTPAERGVLVPVEAGIAKALRPGDWVDVVAVSADEGRSSRLVSGLRVLRVGDSGGAVGSDYWALLAVPPAQAQALAEAGAVGRLRLVLRGGPETTRPERARTVASHGPPRMAGPPGTAAAAGQVTNVEVIRGVDREPIGQEAGSQANQNP